MFSKTAMLFFSVLMCSMKNYSSQELAFIGDAVHTLFIKENIVKISNDKINEIQKTTSKLCSATFQSELLEKSVMPILTEEELDIVRRARNSKSKHAAKNCTRADYSKATAFEALLGWLYTKNQSERLNQILTISLENKEIKC